MKIVDLDGYAANPGDISWDGVKELGEFTFYDYSEDNQIIERAKDAEIVLVNKNKYDKGNYRTVAQIKIYWRISYWLQQYRPTSSQRTWRYCY